MPTPIPTTSRVRLQVQATAQPRGRKPAPQPDCSIYQSILGHIDNPTYWQRRALRAPKDAKLAEVPLYGTARTLARGITVYIEAEATFAQAVAEARTVDEAVLLAQKDVTRALADLAWMLENYPKTAAHPPSDLLREALTIAIPLRRAELRATPAIALPPAPESRTSAVDSFATKMARQSKGQLSPAAKSWLKAMQPLWQAYAAAEAAAADPRQTASNAAFAQLCEALWAAQDRLNSFHVLAFVSVAGGHDWTPAVACAATLLRLRESSLQDDKRYRPRPPPPTPAADPAWSERHANIRTYVKPFFAST